MLLDIEDANTQPLRTPGYVVSYMNSNVKTRSEFELEYTLSLIEDIKTQPLQIPSQPESLTSHPKKNWMLLLGQIVRFGIVGGINTAIDFLLLDVLLWVFPTRVTITVLLFNSIAYSIGAVNSFLLNKYWTFKNYRRPALSEIARFALTTCVGVACSDVILWGASVLLKSWFTDMTLLTNVSKLLAIIGTVGISYLGMRLWVFVQRTKE